MTKYFTQWEADTVNANPSGWTQVGGSGTFNVKYGTPAIKRKQMAVVPGAVSDLRMAAYLLALTVTAIDMLTAVDLATSTNEQHFIYFAGSGTTDFVRGVLIPGTNTIKIQRRAASVTSDVASAALTFDTSATYYMRAAGIDSGDVLRLRVWKEDATEPTTWNIDTTSAGFSPNGHAGLAGYHSAQSDRISYFNFLSVGTNGDSAVRPITNAEYAAWLDRQDVERTVLAEMSVVGVSASAAAYTKSVPIYLATKGYASQAWDVPASRNYREAIVGVPTFSREMGALFRGRAVLGVGDLIVSNANGERDDWLRMKWKRSSINLLLGDPTWPRHDFRPILVGRVAEQPVAEGYGQIRFPLADLSDLLDQPIETATMATGPLAYEAKPVLLGYVHRVDPILLDDTEYTYQISNGADIGSLVDINVDFYDGENQMKVDRTISLVTIATEIISTAVAHGMLVDWVVIVRTGTPPSPLALNTAYYVKSTPASTQFTLALTKGGATINLTTNPTGATFEGFGYDIDTTNGRLDAVSRPTIRALIGSMSQNNNGTGYAKPTQMLKYALQTKLGLAASYFDDVTFDALESAIDAMTGSATSCGVWIKGDKNRGLQVADLIMSGINGWFGWSPDGVMQVGRIELPATTAAMSFTEDDVKAGTLKLEAKLLPAKRSTLQVAGNPAWYWQGPVNLADGTLDAPYVFAPRLSAPAAATPLEDVETETVDYEPFFTIYTGNTNFAAELSRLAELYSNQLGFFSFVTRLSASQLSIGDTIQLTHSRFGWKSYSVTDPASPDNGETIDCTKAVVVGIDANFDSREVKLTVLRRIPQLALEYAPDLPAPLFEAELLDSTTPQAGSGSATFTRATARTALDNSSLVVQPPSGEAAFMGARRLGAASYSRLHGGGAAITFQLLRGIIVEAARTNRLTAPRDGTNAAWTKSASMLTALDQVGEDGVANSATRLKANGAANQTILQAYVAASLARYFNFSVRRITGVGSIEYTVNGGGAWTALSPQPPSTFRRYEIANTLLNPSVGLRIVTNGDEVGMDWTDLEDGVYASTRKLAGARNADVLSYPVAGNLPANDFVVVLDWTPLGIDTGNGAYLWGSYVNGTNWLILSWDTANLKIDKNVAGVGSNAFKALTALAGVTYRVAFRISSTLGLDLWLNGVKGTGSSNTTAPALGTTFEIGASGNGVVQGSQCMANVRHFSGAFTDQQMADLST